MRYLKFLFSIVFMFIIVTSCTTFYETRKLTSDDCLVLIKTKIINPDKLPLVRNYSFKISGYEELFDVPKEEDSFVAIRIINKKSELISVSSDVTRQGYSGKSSDDELKLVLPYKPGSVIVADFMFVLKYKKNSSVSSTVYSGFEDISDEEKDELIKAVKDSSDFDSWWQ